MKISSYFHLLMCDMCYVVSWKKKRQQENTVLHPSGEVVSEFSSIYGEETQEGKASEPLFTFDCIATATGYFSDSNKLGEGGFGHVYKVRVGMHGE